MSEHDDLESDPDEQSIALTTDFRLIQKRRGHRYSVDDMLVAHLAVAARPGAERVLDLGCGLGSVLLITAWKLARARFVGVEALDEHVRFARRNVALNRCEGRAEVVAGDLRDGALIEGLGRFDLVTGSPPYFLADSGTHCADPARAAAHFELRGGIEDYARAAANALRDDGAFVCCAGAVPEGRARQAVRSAGLTLSSIRPVVPREGKDAFLLLLVATRAPSAPTVEHPPLVLRRATGERTAEHIAIRLWTGL